MKARRRSKQHINAGNGVCEQGLPDHNPSFRLQYVGNAPGASRTVDPSIDLSLKMRVTFLFAQILRICERGAEHNYPLVALEARSKFSVRTPCLVSTSANWRSLLTHFTATYEVDAICFMDKRSMAVRISERPSPAD